MIVENISSSHDAGNIAPLIIKDISSFKTTNVLLNDITVSIGIATHPLSSDSPEALRKNSDKAMYEAKKNPGSSFCFFQ